MVKAGRGFGFLLIALLIAIAVACSGGGSGGSSGSGGDGGGGSADGGRSNGQTADQDSGTTLKLFNYKGEIAEQLAELIEIYEQEFGVKVHLETVGGGASYEDALRAKFAQGDYPDIFNNGGYTDLELYLEHLEDLSDEPWVENVPVFAREPMTHEGRLYGMPVGLKGTDIFIIKIFLPKPASRSFRDAVRVARDSGDACRSRHHAVFERIRGMVGARQPSRQRAVCASG